ncbi:MAG: hypothetical protein GX267_10470 [Fibrobacter sp.]|jgi:hypothetical protein|nr:hypothetical protein [Fibrobacter sp.]
MLFVMITDFPNHWDKIKGYLTSYPPKMVKKAKPDQLKSGVKTIFIKKFKDSTDVEKAWSGKIYDIQKIPGSIFFRVEIEKENECPAEYAGYENGWYVE